MNIFISNRRNYSSTPIEITAKKTLYGSRNYTIKGKGISNNKNLNYSQLQAKIDELIKPQTPREAQILKQIRFSLGQASIQSSKDRKLTLAEVSRKITEALQGDPSEHNPSQGMYYSPHANLKDRAHLNPNALITRSKNILGIFNYNLICEHINHGVPLRGMTLKELTTHIESLNTQLQANEKIAPSDKEKIKILNDEIINLLKNVKNSASEQEFNETLQKTSSKLTLINLISDTSILPVEINNFLQFKPPDHETHILMKVYGDHLGFALAQHYNPTHSNQELRETIETKLPEDQRFIAHTRTTKQQLKKLGHIFGLNGVFTLTHKTNFEGAVDFIARGWVADDHINYLNFLDQHKLIQEEHQEITKTLRELTESSVTYGIDLQSKDPIKVQAAAEKMVQDIQEGKPVSMPTGWFGHGSNITIYKNLVLYTNRGERLPGKNLPEGADITIFQMVKAITPEIILKTALTIENSKAINKNTQMEYIEKDGLQKDLGLLFIGNISKVDLDVGNCGYADNKAYFQAGSFALEYARLQEMRPKETRKNFSVSDFTEAASYAQRMYKGAEQFARLRSVQDLISLENLILKFEINLAPDEYCRILGQTTAKMTQLMSEKKQKRIGLGPDAQKGDQYSVDSLYLNTGADVAMLRMREEMKQYIRTSKMPISDYIDSCIFTKKEATQLLTTTAPGTFTIFTDIFSREAIVLEKREDGTIHEAGTLLKTEDGTYVKKDDEAICETLGELASAFNLSLLVDIPDLSKK